MAIHKQRTGSGQRRARGGGGIAYEDSKSDEKLIGNDDHVEGESETTTFRMAPMIARSVTSTTSTVLNE